MSDSAPETLKSLGKELYSNKPLFITVVVGLAAVIYLIYKHSQASIIAPDAIPNAPTGYNYGTIVEEHYIAGPAGPAGPRGPVGPIGPAAPTTTVGSTGAVGPTTTILKAPIAQTNQPPKNPPAHNQPTTGLLGPKVQISKKNGVYVYKTPGGKSGFLSSVLPHGAAVRGGSQGRWWYIQNGLKYLITSGNGPAVTNSGTDANAP